MFRGRHLRTGSRAICALALIGGCVWTAACGASSSAPLTVEAIALPEQLPAKSLKADKTLFIPGETMSFDISLRGVLGGTAVIGVGQPGFVDGKPVIIVRSRVESAGVIAAIKEVRDEIVTWIDLDQGLIVKHEANSKFGEKQAVIASKFGDGKPGTFTLDYQRKGKPNLRVRQTLPPDAFAFDIHAILGQLRSMEVEDGDEESFFLLSGRRLWRSSLQVGAHETIRTATGRHPAIRFDGVAQRVSRGLSDVKKKKPRNYSVWLSDDANRLPLLVMATTEYGELRVELVEYTRPDQRLTKR
jgi:hypothetical protein